jgi:hypothetical protein
VRSESFEVCVWCVGVNTAGSRCDTHTDIHISRAQRHHDMSDLQESSDPTAGGSAPPTHPVLEEFWQLHTAQVEKLGERIEFIGVHLVPSTSEDRQMPLKHRGVRVCLNDMYEETMPYVQWAALDFDVFAQQLAKAYRSCDRTNPWFVSQFVTGRLPTTSEEDTFDLSTLTTCACTGKRREPHKLFGPAVIAKYGRRGNNSTAGPASHVSASSILQFARTRRHNQHPTLALLQTKSFNTL